MTDVFQYLPGTRVRLNDGGLQVTSPAQGEKVTVIGVTTNASIEALEPVEVSTLSEALPLTYHDDGTPSELTFAVAEAFSGGARRVEIVKIQDEDVDGNPTASGRVYTASGSGWTISDDLTKAERYDLLDDAYANLLAHDVDYVVPIGVYLDDPAPAASGQSYTRDFGWQLAKFCYDVTRGQETAIGIIPNRNELELAYEGKLADSNGDYIAADTTVDVVHGTPKLSHMSGYVNALKTFKNATYYDGIGYGGVDSKYRPTAYEYFLNGSDNGVPGTIADAELDDNNWPIDMGKYLQVVAGHVVHNNFMSRIQFPEQSGLYNGNLAVHYAAMSTRLPSEVSPTNQPLTGLQVRRKFSISQLNDLVHARYVVPQVRPGAGLVICDAMTAAWNYSRYYRSDYTRYTTMRTVNEITDGVREVVNPYIGQPANPNISAAIQNALDSLMSAEIERGAILSGQAAFTQTPEQRVLNEATVEVTLVLPGEIRQVFTVVGLSRAAA